MGGYLSYSALSFDCLQVSKQKENKQTENVCVCVHVCVCVAFLLDDLPLPSLTTTHTLSCPFISLSLFLSLLPQTHMVAFRPSYGRRKGVCVCVCLLFAFFGGCSHIYMCVYVYNHIHMYLLRSPPYSLFHSCIHRPPPIMLSL